MCLFGVKKYYTVCGSALTLVFHCIIVLLSCQFSLVSAAVSWLCVAWHFAFLELELRGKVGRKDKAWVECSIEKGPKSWC